LIVHWDSEGRLEIVYVGDSKTPQIMGVGMVQPEKLVVLVQVVHHGTICWGWDKEDQLGDCFVLHFK
jgi:hypothetical protein